MLWNVYDYYLPTFYEFSPRVDWNPLLTSVLSDRYGRSQKRDRSNILVFQTQFKISFRFHWVKKVLVPIKTEIQSPVSYYSVLFDAPTSIVVWEMVNYVGKGSSRTHDGRAAVYACRATNEASPIRVTCVAGEPRTEPEHHATRPAPTQRERRRCRVGGVLTVRLNGTALFRSNLIRQK